MSGGYDPTFFAKLDAVEDRHFWFRARKRAVGAVIRRIAKSCPPRFNALELGCGNGGMLRLLQECCPRGKVFGMDLFAEGLVNAAQRSSAPLVRGDVHHPPFGEAFMLIGMFDVLEHVQADVSVLHDVRKMLAPGGRLCLTVPAHMSLWSYFDEASQHARRYSPRMLEDKLRSAGFELEYATQFMSCIYPLVWLGRRLNRRRGGDVAEMTRTELRIVPGLNGLLDWALSGEEDLIRRRRRISLGTSLLTVARRL